MSKKNDQEVAGWLIGGLVVLAVVYQAVLWVWHLLLAVPWWLWLTFAGVTALLAAGAWAVYRSEPDVKAEHDDAESVGPMSVASFTVVALLFGILGSCTGFQDRNDAKDQERELAQNGGGSVHVVADESTCWVLKSYNTDQAAVLAEQNTVEVQGVEHSTDGAGEPTKTPGCGTQDVPLSLDNVTDALVLAFDDDEDRHPLAWAALYWVARNSSHRGGFLIGGNVSGASLYRAVPNATFRAVERGDLNNKITDGFAPTGITQVDLRPWGRAAKGAGADINAMGAEAFAAAASLATTADPEAQDDAFASFAAATRGAHIVRQIAEEYAFQDILDSSYSTVGPKTASRFSNALDSLANTGRPGSTLAAAIRKAAFDAQVKAAKVTHGSGSYEYDWALDIVPVLRALDPSREAETASLEAALKLGFDRAAAQEAAEESLWDSGGGFDVGGGTVCGPGDRDGDGDGICNES